MALSTYSLKHLSAEVITLNSSHIAQDIPDPLPKAISNRDVQSDHHRRFSGACEELVSLEVWDKLERSVMRLASLVPSISAELVAGLDAVGIRTESDLLFSVQDPREILRRLPPDSFSLGDLETAIDIVAELSAAPGMSCFDLLALEAPTRGRDTQPLVTGNDNADRILSGLGRRRLIQISGDKGSGKSVWLSCSTADNVHTPDPIPHSDPRLESCRESFDLLP